jgi:hypothetical protein
MLYNNLSISATEQNPAGTFITDPPYTTIATAGYSIVFAKPTP